MIGISPDGLGGVGVEQRPALAGGAGEIFDELQHAGLVVGGPDRHQGGPRGDRLRQMPGVHAPVVAHGQIGHLGAVLTVPGAAGLQHRRMLGDLGDHLNA